MTKLGQALQDRKAAKVAEIAILFVVAIAMIGIGWKIVGENIFARQAVVWFANIVMMAIVWAGLRLRGQTFEHFGLSFRFSGWRPLVRTVLLSTPVMIAALLSFVVGQTIMVIIMQDAAPELQKADLSSYAFLQGNLPMFLLTMAGVYIVSSFGEEIIYRGFLINRLGEFGKGGRSMRIIAAVISAIIFGLIHFSWGITGVVQTTVMGLALAAAYFLTKRNLWVLVLAHVYLDTLLLAPLYLAPSAAPAG